MRFSEGNFPTIQLIDEVVLSVVLEGFPFPVFQIINFADLCGFMREDMQCTSGGVHPI